MSLFTRPFIVAAIVAGSILAHANVSEAGPILDWLFNRRQERLQRREARRNPQPIVTNYAPYVAGVAGCNSCQSSCTTVCRPAPQIQVNYTPQTSYKYGWLQVPVTSYKPSTTVDPCTGCSVVSMKPCTSYTWKLSRIPYTTYRPTFTTTQAPTTVSYAPPSSACCGQPTTISQVGSVAPVSTTYTGPASAAPALSSGCSSCGTASSVMSSASPTTSYYPSTPSNQYSSNYPPVGQSQTTIGQSYTVPVSPSTEASQGTIIQSPSGGAADTAPSIGAGQTSNFGSLGEGQSGATIQAPSGDASVLQGSGASSKTNISAFNSAPATASRSSNLRPVPDPDAHLRQRMAPVTPQPESTVPAPPKSGAPRLLDPRDRTASNLIRPAVYVRAASWPELNAPTTSIAAEASEPVMNEPAAPAPLQPLLGQARDIRAAGEVQQSSAMTPVSAPALVAPITPRFEPPRVNVQRVPTESVWDDSGWQSIK